ncbi:hypothetical protein ACFPM0_16080 [Pseudonocardia sulfidoxydans]|uniref:hypothetical protein n=1 Tax=Pseudonocardia sulfidoxydans TaxID=54011 RepID=UPI00362280B4
MVIPADRYGQVREPIPRYGQRGRSPCPDVHDRVGSRHVADAARAVLAGPSRARLRPALLLRPIPRTRASWHRPASRPVRRVPGASVPDLHPSAPVPAPPPTGVDDRCRTARGRTRT